MGWLLEFNAKPRGAPYPQAPRSWWELLWTSGGLWLKGSLQGGRWRIL